MSNDWVKKHGMKVLYVSQGTKDMLAGIGDKRERFEDVILRLIKHYNEVKE